MIKRLFIITALLLASATFAGAHFAAVIPSDEIISFKDKKKITIQVSILDPFEGMVTRMKKPAAFEVITSKGKKSIIGKLDAVKTDNTRIWTMNYKIKVPGEHVLAMTSAPTFVNTERQFKIYYTKTYISALGKEVDWHTPLGMQVEIIPMSRPYGIWTGNTFTGMVYINGKPAPDTMVEIAYLNNGEITEIVKAPKSTYATQKIITDPNGIFNYTMPRAGWWGFSAIHMTDKILPRKNKHYPLEEIGTIWVRSRDMASAPDTDTTDSK